MTARFIRRMIADYRATVEEYRKITALLKAGEEMSGICLEVARFTVEVTEPMYIKLIQGRATMDDCKEVRRGK